MLLVLGCQDTVVRPAATPIDVPTVRGSAVAPEPLKQAEPASRVDVESVQAEFDALAPEDVEAWCRIQVNVRGDGFEACRLRTIGNGAALVLSIVTGCGGDSCDVDAWLLSSRLEEPFGIDDAGGTIEAAPDGSFIVVDDNVMVAPGQWKITTTRVDVPSGKRSRLADCFSAKLSPAGKYFVCRDRAANVLRVPLTGGATEMVVDAQRPKDVVQWVPYAYLYPGTVEFPSPTQLAYDVQYTDGAVFRAVVAWEE